MLLHKLAPWRADSQRRIREARAVAKDAEARLLETKLDGAMVDFLSYRLDKLIEEESDA